VSTNPNVPGVPIDDDPLVQIITDLGVTCQYRQYYIAAGESGGSLTAGTNVKQPIGTHDASYDATEHAATDSTVDAGTGFTPAYAPAVSVRAYFPPPVVFNIAGIGQVGADLQETQDYVYLLSRDMVPSRNDLLIHPNGERYVIGEQQRAVITTDRPAAYRVSVEHRVHGDPVYTVV
jgi:hypothetical protein